MLNQKWKRWEMKGRKSFWLGLLTFICLSSHVSCSSVVVPSEPLANIWDSTIVSEAVRKMSEHPNSSKLVPAAGQTKDEEEPWNRSTDDIATTTTTEQPRANPPAAFASKSTSSSNGQFVTSQTTDPTLIPALSKATRRTPTVVTTSIRPSERPSPVKAPTVVKIPSSASSSSPASTPGGFQTEDDEQIMKQSSSSSLNLLRKLWSSTRTTKLNVTQEHESILRVEPLPNDGRVRTGRTTDPTQNACPDQCNPTPSTTTTVVSPLKPLNSATTNDVDNGGKGVEPLAARTIFKGGEREYEKHGTTTFVGTRALIGPTHHKKYRGIERVRSPANLYPEWLSSGGVYPDDGSNNSNNFTTDYYMEYESSGEGAGDGPATTITTAATKIFNPGENEEERGGGDGEIMDEAYEQSGTEKTNTLLRKRLNDDVLAKVLNRTAGRIHIQEHNNAYIDKRGNGGEEVAGGDEDEIGAVSSSNGPHSHHHYHHHNVEIGASFERNQGTGSLAGGSGGSSSAVQPGLADVISRGRIDSVMYVYFGDKYNDYHKEEIAGRIIQAVGGVVAAIAQVLTVLGAAKCIRRVTNSPTLPVHLHCGFALLLSNLLLLLAVHATEPVDICATVALLLHYLHLVIGCWLFAHTVKTYRALCRHVAAPNLLSSGSDAEQDSPGESFRMVKPSTVRYSVAAWTAPVPFLIMSYLINPDGYETRRYCWMSIEKGMVISFIVPIFLLIGLNTFLVVLSLRHLLALRKLWEDAGEVDEDYLDAKIISKGIRASAMLLPLLAISWFLGVVALENSTSIFFQLASTLANIALSWLVMYFLGDDVWPEAWCPCSKLDGTRQDLSSLYDDPSGSNPSVQPSAQLSFDNEPLLASPAPVPSTSSNAVSFSSSSSTSSISASAGNGCYSKNAKYRSVAGGPKVSSTTTTSSTSVLTPSSCSSQAIPRPHPSTSRWSKSNRPNWSRPGGNEIYELRQDAISTIYK